MYLFCHSASVALAQSAVPVLEPGAPIKRELKRGEKHLYRITLNAGQYLHAFVDPEGIRVAVKIYGTGDRLLATGGSGGGEQRIFFVAEVAGEYRLEVNAFSTDTPQGHYEVKIAALQPATDDDRSRYLAQELLADLNQDENATSQARQEMIARYEKAVKLWRQLGDRTGEADAFMALATANSHSNSLSALENLGQALLLVRATGDRWREVSVLEMVGVIDQGRGDMYQGLAAHAQSLALARELKDGHGEQLNLYQIGYIYRKLGEAQQALDYNYQLLKLQGPDDASRELSLHGLCQSYLLLSEPLAALEYCRRALPVWQANGRRPWEAATLGSIGQAYSLLGDVGKELDYYNQALRIFREVEERLGEANTLRSIGQWYQLQGDHQKALKYHQEALALYHTNQFLQSEGITLRLIGQVYESLGDTEKAIDYFNRALLIFRSLRDLSNEAAALLGIARTERDLGQLNEARREIEAALAILESLSGKVSRPDWRVSYLATKREYYEFYIDLLMSFEGRQPNEGFAALAFQVSERARARGLMESLAEARVDIHQGVDPALLTREVTIKQQLSVKSIRLTQLLGGKHSPAEEAAVRDEVEALLQSYAAVEAEIRMKSPHYSALQQPPALNLREVQTKLLDPDTLLLEYSLGEKRSFVWAVTPTSITSFELPGRTSIETAARLVYETLTARSKAVPKETAEQKQIRVEQADSDYPRAAAELSRMLLGPAASLLATKRLLIVADGALQYVPFGALPTPKYEGGGMKDERANSLHPSSVIPHPLIVDHEIVSLPSASVLAALREDTAGRQAATRMVAVLADPVFQRDDPRLGQALVGKPSGTTAMNTASSQIPDAVVRSAEESGLKDFVRLHFTRAEADAIVRLVPASQRLEAVDFLANRTTATSADLGQYRIVHFATHGLINSQHPELSGIVLSLVDQKGQPQNGFLRLYEIYNLKLNADLVVLSACQTALGKEIKGEGLIGLTRGFMYAGAPRVVASLWRIDDRATAELMSRFYRGMIKNGLAPAAALRAAQISMWQEKRWTAPHYWAAFTIQGEWK
jgi:CHAT domain-containing protein